MTITIGVAINNSKFVLSYHRIKRVKPPLMQRIKNVMVDIYASLVSPMVAVNGMGC